MDGARGFMIELRTTYVLRREKRVPMTSAEHKPRRAARALVTLTAAIALFAGLPAPVSADSATGSYLAARHASNLNDYDFAATYFTRALARDSNNTDLMEQAVLYKVAAGRVREAVPIARQLVNKEADHRIAQMVLVVDHLRKSEYDKASERLETFGSESFNVITSQLLKGWTEQGKGDTEAAQDAFAELGGQSLFGYFGRYHAALATAIDDDAEATDAAFKAAIGEETPSVRMAEAYGRFLERDGRGDEAAEIYGEAMASAPTDPVLSAAMDRATSSDSDKPALLVSNAQEGVAEALFGLAGAFAREDGGVRLSLVYVQLALALNPGMEASRVLLGNVMEAQQRWEPAAETYGMVSKDSPYYRIAQIGRADALGRIDKIDEALETLTGLEKDFPDEVSLPIARGDLLRRVERYEEAGIAYDRAIELTPEPEARHWSLFYARGVCRERTGDWDAAEADLKKALEFRPNQAHVLNYLGYSWIEQGRNLEEAREMIERAVAMRPDDGYIADSLGWVQYRLGDFEEAVKTMERAVELNPTDPVINDHYGDTLWAVGRKLEARFQWKRALSFKPEEEGLKERIIAKLADGLDVVLEAEKKALPDEAEGVAEREAEPEVPVIKDETDKDG